MKGKYFLIQNPARNKEYRQSEPRIEISPPKCKHSNDPVLGSHPGKINQSLLHSSTLHFRDQIPQTRRRKGAVPPREPWPLGAPSWHRCCHLQPHTVGSTRLDTAAHIQHGVFYSHGKKTITRLLLERRNQGVIKVGFHSRARFLTAGTSPRQPWAGAPAMQSEQRLQLSVTNIW